MYGSSQAKTNTIFPGEKELTVVAANGIIGFDVNGEKEPNVYGKDRFKVPLGEKGIIWDAEDVCGTGKYKSGSTCVNCSIAHCDDCTSATQCYTCSSGYHKDGAGGCVAN